MVVFRACYGGEQYFVHAMVEFSYTFSKRFIKLLLFAPVRRARMTVRVRSLS